MSGYVYFIQAKRCRLIKIGFSETPMARLQQLQMMSPDRLVLLAVQPGTTESEHALHVKFAKSRQHGEWFKPGKRLLHLIDDVLANVDQTIKPRAMKAVPPPVVKAPPKPKPLPASMVLIQKWIREGRINPVTKLPYGAVTPTEAAR